MEVKKIPIGPSGIDDLFIFKHSLEADIAKKSEDKEIHHIPVDKFITDYVQLGKCSFTHGATHETVAFSIMQSESSKVCFYTDEGISKETLKRMFTLLEKMKWDLTKLKPQNPKDVFYMENIDDKDLFVINGKMTFLDD